MSLVLSCKRRHILRRSLIQPLNLDWWSCNMIPRVTFNNSLGWPRGEKFVQTIAIEWDSIMATRFESEWKFSLLFHIILILLNTCCQTFNYGVLHRHIWQLVKWHSGQLDVVFFFFYKGGQQMASYDYPSLPRVGKTHRSISVKGLASTTGCSLNKICVYWFFKFERYLKTLVKTDRSRKWEFWNLIRIFNLMTKIPYHKW